MKLLITLFTLSLSLAAHASFELTPGLWDVKYTIKTDGKTFDPQAEIKKAMDKMTPEQRKQMEAMLSKAGNHSISADGMKICLTKEMLAKDNALMQKDNKDCKMNFTEKSPTKISAKFTCKNGTTGTANWNFKSAGKAYDGQVTVTQSKTESAEITHEGTWASADCGKVKPIQ